jgi:ribosomal protein S27AE
MVERQVSGDDPEINEAEDDPEEPAAKSEDQPEVDPETSAPETSATSRASTDGGPRPPPEPDVDVEDQDGGNDDPAEAVEDVDGSDTVDCPNCGEDTGLSADDHDQGGRYHCLECNERYLWHEQ